MRSNKLIVFVKAPRPGRVKTRLAETIGSDAAAAAYRTLVETLLSHLATISAVELRFSPDDALDEIRPWLRNGWQTRPQGGGDLGERMLSAFIESFAEGAERVVVIGSDCPSILHEDIDAAWAALRDVDVVLGPATDGGYWLIGLRAMQPALFANIEWSTDTVFQETLNRARTAGLSVHLLRELTDIDTEKEWADFSRSKSAPAIVNKLNTF